MSGLLCSVCIYLPERAVSDAVTVLNGQAVCREHLGLVDDSRMALARQLWRETKDSQ